MDERGISREFIDHSQRGLRQVMDGGFLTGGALIELPLIRLMQLGGLSEAVIRMLLKSVWWICGNGIVAALAAALLRLRRPGARLDPFRFAGAFAAIALLPTTQLAIKTVNYDLLSCGLGALAIFIYARRAVTGERRLYRAALILASLAAQEKLTAGPVLVFIIGLEALLRAAAAATLRARCLAALRSAGPGLLAALAISLASCSLYRMLGPPNVPLALWARAVAPLASWTYLPLGLATPIGGLAITSRWLATFGATIAAIFIALLLAAAVLPLLQRVVMAWARLRGGAPFVLLAILIASIYATGIYAALTITAYWAPFHPAQLPHMPAYWAVFLHTGATTFARHYLQLTLYAVAVLVVAIPSGIWAVAGLGLIFAGMGGREMPSRTITIGLLLVAGALVQPTASVLANLPFANRYFDLSLTLLAGGLVLAGLTAFDAIPGTAAPWRRTAMPLALALCLIIETAPFRPLFAAFRPFWLSYADADRAEPGRLNASWMGWGEDVMAAGKMLDAACAARDPAFAGHRCANITLYFMDDGWWLPGPRRIRVRYFPRGRETPLNDRSFYLLSRLYLIQKVYDSPRIAPDFVVSFRGYVLGWVFRGDRLAASGYHFGAAAAQLSARPTAHPPQVAAPLQPHNTGSY
ncbi:MAG TPA: hypothetical protein VGR91_11875 [Stellaceae bacterium]|nr:hypothetical protein [Stellaceae bacterium]